MTSAGPWERLLNDIRPRKRPLKWGCATSREDGDEDRGDVPAALAITRTGYADLAIHEIIGFKERCI